MRQPLARLPDRLTDEVTDAISWLTKFKDKFCAIDIETSGVDAFTSQIYLVSVSDGEETVVFDWRELCNSDTFLTEFKDFLTTADLVAHNSLFEQSFFLAQVGVQANIVADTMVMHQILTAGLPDKSSLEALYQKYFGIPLDKKWQKYFLNLKPDETIDPDAIAYSAGDVVKLVELARILEGELEREGLLHIWTDIEKPFLPIVAQAKHRGISVDENVLFELKGELEFAQYKALRNFGKLTGDKPSMDGKLLIRTVPKLNINSADQLLNLFRSLGCDVEKTDEETLKYLTQKARREVRAIAQSVLDYRQVTKVLGTYVIPLLKEHRNERTGRIHPDWKQCSTDTGRMACANPNMQNLPSKGPYARIREAFIAEPGHKLIVADYSQMELRVLAELSQEPRLIEAFTSGSDLHTLSTCILFPHLAIESLDLLYMRYGVSKDRQVSEVLSRMQEGTDQKASSGGELQTRGKNGQDTKTGGGIGRKSGGTEEFFLEGGNNAEPPKEVYGVSVREVRQREVSGSPPSGQEQEEQHSRKLRDAMSILPRIGTQSLCELKPEWKEKRQIGKTYGFALAYGAGPKTLSEQTGLSYNECERLLGKFFDGYPVLKEYLDQSAQYAKDHLCCKTPAGRKRFFTAVTDEGSDRIRKLAAIGREGTNGPIQGCNADVTKIASILFVERNQFDAHIVIFCHDEIVVECLEDEAEEVKELLETCMKEAGKRYLKSVPVEVSLTIGERWTK